MSRIGFALVIGAIILGCAPMSYEMYMAIRIWGHALWGVMIGIGVGLMIAEGKMPWAH